MDTLEQIKESGIAPNEFWYLSTLILTGILVVFMGVLIFFVKGFFSELKETIDELKDNLTELKSISKVHENRLANLEKPRRR